MIDINKLFQEIQENQLKLIKMRKNIEDDGRVTCEVFGDFGEDEKTEREEALENMFKVGD
jgi:hypothetical protein